MGMQVMAEKTQRPRTIKQNSTLHLWLTHIADELNDHGLDMQVVLAKRHGIMWTPEAVKECLFKVLAKAMFNKDSTTQLSTKEFTQVTNMLRDVLARDYGVNVEVPSLASMQEEQKERVWRG